MITNDMKTTKQPRRFPVFYGWWIVVVAAVGLFMGYGPIVSFTFGIFLNPLAQEFGWGRGEITLAFSLSVLVMSVASPTLGKLADRFGARRVILPSALIFGIGLASLSLLTASLWLFYAIYLIMGLVGGGTAPIPYSKVISSWFDKKRGLALGLMMVGLGLGAFMMPSLASALILGVGWRQAYVVIGATTILATVPLVGLFLRESAQGSGLPLDGESNPERTSTASVTHATELGMSSAQARRTSEFWLMAGVFFFVSSACHAGLIHMVPMLTDRGMSAQSASLSVSLLGGALLTGRVLAGYMMDRFFAPHVALGFFIAVAGGLSLLWGGATGAPAFLAAFLVGLGLGAEVDVIAYVASRYFGLRAFGEIYGYLFAAFLLGAVVGPLLMAFAFDYRGSYQLTLGLFVVTTVLAAGLITRLGPYRTWTFGVGTVPAQEMAHADK